LRASHPPAVSAGPIPQRYRAGKLFLDRNERVNKSSGRPHRAKGARGVGLGGPGGTGTGQDLKKVFASFFKKKRFLTLVSGSFLKKRTKKLFSLTGWR
jgi:hypothetical protein